MATDYFDFLNQSSQQEKPTTEEPKGDGLVNLTVRADAECQLVCDGDFLLLLDANQIVKEKAPVGQHILQFISIEHPDICVEKIVDWPDAGKNYLVIVNELMPLIAGKAKQAAEEEKARNVVENERLKTESERPKEDIVVENVVGKSSKRSFQQLFNEYGILWYEGEVLDGKAEGYGTAYSDEGNILYIGEWKDGNYNGHGIERSTDGKRIQYNGEWKDGYKHGRGTEYDYLCDWNNDPPTILLTFTREAQWEKNYTKGQVICKWSDGGVWEGNCDLGGVSHAPLTNRQPCPGHVKYTSPNGCVYEGDFPGDKFSKAVIKMTRPNGEVVVGSCAFLDDWRFSGWYLEIDSPASPLIRQFDDGLGGLMSLLHPDAYSRKEDVLRRCVLPGKSFPIH